VSQANSRLTTLLYEAPHAEDRHARILVVGSSGSDSPRRSRTALRRGARRPMDRRSLVGDLRRPGSRCGGRFPADQPRQ